MKYLYFFLSFQYDTMRGLGFVNLTCAFERFPTHKECKNALTEQMPDAKNVVLLGISKLTKNEYEIFKSEK